MVERLFEDVQSMHNAMPIQAEEKLFIDAIRGLNYQAQKLQAEEISNFGPAVDQAEAQVVTSFIQTTLVALRACASDAVR